MSDGRGTVADTRAFMGRLARDTRANTLALMTMALIPLAGMVGGGIDISRMYIVKTRLQHACDAGALAGRKTMGGGTWGDTPRQAAEKFFDANYDKNAYGLNPATVTKVFAENAGKVTGTANATVPMTLMRIFGKTNEPLSVTCDAEMRLPNTDVMFVLDTTGSMDEDDGTGTKKINGLKKAVKCFYEIVARLDTNAACDSTPSGGTGNQVQIRFGFVPYASNVNVGRLLKTEWMADSWFYQTRKLANTPSGSWGSWSGKQTGSCSSIPTNTEARQYTIDSQDWWGNCTYRYRNWSGTAASWNYDRLSQTVSGLKSGTNWNASFTLPIGPSGAQQTINWDGCIQERKTAKTDNYSPIPSDAKDLDIDLVPTSDTTTQWGPALPGVIFTRKSTGSSGTGSWDTAALNGVNTIYTNTSGYSCPTEAKRMQSWTASNFDTYVDSLNPQGNTYHDIGLLWGARLVSPNGLFADDNDYTPQGGEIERHIIFMTDGDTNTQPSDYNAYGVPWFDKLQTNSTSQSDLDTQVDKRFAALCTAIKNATFKGKPVYTLWVISFGKVSSDTETRLTNCATSGRYFSTKTSSELQTQFRKIADQISQLRLTK